MRELVHGAPLRIAEHVTVNVQCRGCGSMPKLPLDVDDGCSRFQHDASGRVTDGVKHFSGAIKTNVGDSVNVVVHLERRPGRRFVSEVVEIYGYDPDRDEYNYGFIFDSHKEVL